MHKYLMHTRHYEFSTIQCLNNGKTLNLSLWTLKLLCPQRVKATLACYLKFRNSLLIDYITRICFIEIKSQITEVEIKSKVESRKKKKETTDT